MSIFKKESPTLESSQVSAKALEIIRKDLLNELLQDDTDKISYWLGKSLARKHSLKTLDEVTAFFLEAGFGELTLKKETKKSMTFQLTSDIITYRFATKEHPSYKLEAGFLAENMQNWTNVITECYEELDKSNNQILLNLVWDAKQTIE